MKQSTLNTETFQSIVIEKIKKAIHGFYSIEYDIIYQHPKEDHLYHTFIYNTGYFSSNMYNRLKNIIDEYDFMWHVSVDLKDPYNVIVYLYKNSI